MQQTSVLGIMCGERELIRWVIRAKSGYIHPKEKKEKIIQGWVKINEIDLEIK